MMDAGPARKAVEAQGQRAPSWSGCLVVREGRGKGPAGPGPVATESFAPDGSPEKTACAVHCRPGLPAHRHLAFTAVRRAGIGDSFPGGETAAESRVEASMAGRGTVPFPGGEDAPARAGVKHGVAPADRSPAASEADKGPRRR